MTTPRPADPHVLRVTRGDRTWLYYRRGGRRWPLPGPEGSALFLDAYNRIHASYGTLRAATPAGTPGTVEAAVILYLQSADYLGLAERTRRDYRRVLDGFRQAFGALHLAELDVAWWEGLRDKYARAPIAWNNLRSRMREVIALYRKRHRALCPDNPLLEVKRLAVGQSDQNRAWPADALRRVLVAATPNFRALLIAYLLTAQRGGDVTAWRWSHYQQGEAHLDLRQRKTGRALPLHVPTSLAEVIAAQPVQHEEFLLCSPRGRPWSLGNAQETLARLLLDLGLPRYTLHGLRATGPTSLKRLGMDNRQLRELTGHTTDASLEVYLRGAGGYEARREAQERLEAIYDPVLSEAVTTGNQRRFAGVTGRAARRVQTDVQTDNSDRPRNSRKVSVS